jgi:hypothetical protein
MTWRAISARPSALGAADARPLTLDARAGSTALRAKGAEALELAKDMCSNANDSRALQPLQLPAGTVLYAVCP